MLKALRRYLTPLAVVFFFAMNAHASDQTDESRCDTHVGTIEAAMDWRLSGKSANKAKRSLSEMHPAKDYLDKVVDQVYELPEELLRGSKREEVLALIRRDCLAQPSRESED